MNDQNEPEWLKEFKIESESYILEPSDIKKLFSRPHFNTEYNRKKLLSIISQSIDYYAQAQVFEEILEKEGFDKKQFFITAMSFRDAVKASIRFSLGHKELHELTFDDLEKKGRLEGYLKYQKTAQRLHEIFPGNLRNPAIATLFSAWIIYQTILQDSYALSEGAELFIDKNNRQEREFMTDLYIESFSPPTAEEIRESDLDYYIKDNEKWDDLASLNRLYIEVLCKKILQDY